jgi:O-acetyl-ADP-ribose deacetylase (regulator of RNase III)/tellurite resistance protein
MVWQAMLGFIITEVVPGLRQLFNNVIVPLAVELLKFTLSRLPRIPIYLRLLWAIYTDSEPNSEARRYLTSVLLILSSILSFMAYCYVPLTGAFLIGSLMTPVAAMLALVICLVALDKIFNLNQEYLRKKFPEEFTLVNDDITDLKTTLGKNKWEKMVEHTQALLDDIKKKVDSNGVYDDTLAALIKGLDEYLWNPESDITLSQEEVNKRIIEEGLPPFGKVGGSAAEGALAGTIVGGLGHGALSSIFVQAGFLTGIKAMLGLAGGIVVGPAAYTALVVAAPISMAVIAGAGVFWGANTLRNEGEKKKLSKFLAEVLIAALPMAWVDGVLSQDEEDMIERLMQNAAVNKEDMQRIREAVRSHQSFDQVLQEGLLKEKEPRKQQMKRRLILCTAYELAKADGSISPEELALHDRMAKIMDMQEPEMQEMRRLLLLKSGLNIHDRITVVQGDITQDSVDAIVNSVNPNLRPGQKFGLINLPGKRNRVDTLIHQVAGSDLKKECQQLDGCALGEAKLTKGYNLPADWVIHTVAPIWNDDEAQARSLLNQCYYNSLVVAFENSVETIAFPALGTGVGQIPVDEAAAIAIATVREFLDRHFTIRQVKFVCNDAQVYQEFMRILERQIGVLPEADAFDASTLNQPTHHHYTYPQAA